MTRNQFFQLKQLYKLAESQSAKISYKDVDHILSLGDHVFFYGLLSDKQETELNKIIKKYNSALY